MEAATAVPAHDLKVNDSMGSPLSTGDRVQVTGSSRFGTDNGTVIGAVKPPTDLRLDENGDLTDAAEGAAPRIRVRMDNGTDGDDYTASQGRVSKIDEENQSGDGDSPDEAPADD